MTTTQPTTPATSTPLGFVADANPYPMSQQLGGLNPFVAYTNTPGYVPNDVYWARTLVEQTIPRFTPAWVSGMLRDPRVDFGLRLIRGPITSFTKFNVEAQDETVNEFIVSTIERFWRIYAPDVLRFVEWGWSAAEVFHRVNPLTGLTEFDRIKPFHAFDVNPVVFADKVIGITVRHARLSVDGRATLAMPRFIYAVHEPSLHPYRGASRLRGAFPPYLEKWGRRGQRDSRKLWMVKYAFDGGTMYFPDGATKQADGTMKGNNIIAREIMEFTSNGGTRYLPNVKKAQLGDEGWRYEPPNVPPPPEAILAWGDSLNTEIWEGMGIPPEVAQAADTGGLGDSQAGRSIPQEAFYASLDEVIVWVWTAFERYILKPLLRWNFGEVEYQAMPVSLNESKATMDAGMDPSQAAEDFALAADGQDGSGSDKEGSKGKDGKKPSKPSKGKGKAKKGK